MGKASKLNSSKSSASGTGWVVITDGGRAKASVHHESQSNDCAGKGKGSETTFFLGARSGPRGFFTEHSSTFDSDKRLFRGRGGGGEESTPTGVVGREGKWEVNGGDSGEVFLNSAKRHLAPHKVKEQVTYIRRLRGEGEVGWASGGSSEYDRFRFRER